MTSQGCPSLFCLLPHFLRPLFAMSIRIGSRRFRKPCVWHVRIEDPLPLIDLWRDEKLRNTLSVQSINPSEGHNLCELDTSLAQLNLRDSLPRDAGTCSYLLLQHTNRAALWGGSRIPPKDCQLVSDPNAPLNRFDVNAPDVRPPFRLPNVDASFGLGARAKHASEFARVNLSSRVAKCSNLALSVADVYRSVLGCSTLNLAHLPPLLTPVTHHSCSTTAALNTALDLG